MREYVYLEGDEVLLVGGDVIFNLVLLVRLRKRVGVLALRQQHNLYVHSRLQHHVDAAQRGLDAGGVAVVYECDAFGEALHQVDVALGEGGAAGGHHVFQAALRHRYHIGIALHHVALVLPGDGIFGLIEAVQGRPALGIDYGFWRIDVLGGLLFRREDAPAKGDDFAGERVDGEHHPLVVAVGEAAVVVLGAEAGFHQIFLLIAILQGEFGKDVEAGRGISQAEFLYGVVGKAAVAEVAQADHPAAFRVPEDILIELLRRLVHNHQALAAHARLRLFRSFFFLNDLDAVFVG